MAAIVHLSGEGCRPAGLRGRVCLVRKPGLSKIAASARQRRRGEVNGFRRHCNRGPEYRSATSQSQGKDQEDGPTCLQREKRKGQILWWTSETLVLRRRCAREGMWLRRESLGSERRSLSLRILPDALPAQCR